MTNLIPEDIVWYLSASGIAASGTTLFANNLPDTPASCIAVFEYAGERIELPDNFEKAGIQIRCRNTSSATALRVADQVIRCLHGVGHATMNGQYYDLIRALGSPMHMGESPKGQWHYSVNFTVIRSIN